MASPLSLVPSGLFRTVSNNLFTGYHKKCLPSHSNSNFYHRRFVHSPKNIPPKQFSHQTCYAIGLKRKIDTASMNYGLLLQKQFNSKLFANEDILFIRMTNDAENDVMKNTSYSIASPSIFIFRSLGVAVCWDSSKTDLERWMDLCESYYNGPIVSISESSNELLPVKRNHSQTSDLTDGTICLTTQIEPSKDSDDLIMHQLAFSNSLALSVKLSHLESLLDEYVRSIRHVPNELIQGGKSGFSRTDVLKKAGEIQNLRLMVNLDFDFVGDPDYLWDNDVLNRIFNKSCTYLDVRKRANIVNEKISHCESTVNLLHGHLHETHSFRLEWGIIILIMMEVIFEVIHLIMR